MKKNLILLLATLLLAWQPSVAQDSYGPGAISCGSMLSILDKQRGTDRELMENLFKAWMTGYLSALNLAVFHVIDGANTELDDVHAHFRWLLNYCEENPLDMVPDASVKLFEELVRRNAE